MCFFWPLMTRSWSRFGPHSATIHHSAVKRRQHTSRSFVKHRGNWRHKKKLLLTDYTLRLLLLLGLKRCLFVILRKTWQRQTTPGKQTNKTKGPIKIRLAGSGQLNKLLATRKKKRRTDVFHSGCLMFQTCHHCRTQPELESHERRSIPHVHPGNSPKKQFSL